MELFSCGDSQDLKEWIEVTFLNIHSFIIYIDGGKVNSLKRWILRTTTGISLSVATVSTALADNVTAPKNYSQYKDMMFEKNMTSWGMMENFTTVSTSVIGENIFWGIVIGIPFITLYTRQNGVILSLMVFLFSAGTLMVQIPEVLNTAVYWLLALSITGIIYHMLKGKK